MTKVTHYFLALGLVTGVIPTTTNAENQPLTLPAISVHGTKPNTATQNQIDLLLTPPNTPFADTADYLQSLPGVNVSRFGGHGLEPVIRGQSQNQLNVLANGTMVLGACPNRMDPPTAYQSLTSFDTVTVTRGYQSVLNGPGAPGGTIQFEHSKPELDETLSLEGHLIGGFAENGSVFDGETSLLFGNEDFYLQPRASIKDAGSYQDGQGETVPSAYLEKSTGLRMGWTPKDAHVELSYGHHRIDDALFPGAGMDSPEAISHQGRFSYQQTLNGNTLKDFKLTAFGSTVDHIMNNFSLRTRSKPPFREVDSESDTYGLSLDNTLAIGSQTVKTQFIVQHNERNATRFQGKDANTVNQVQAILWPGISHLNVGLGVETTYDVAMNTRLTIGGRYDYVTADFDKANSKAKLTNLSPNDLYQQFYGTKASQVNEHNLGGLIRLEHQLSDELTATAGLSRSVRTADATERGLANHLVMKGTNKSWIGNPDINPEAHHQLEAGLSYQNQSWSVHSSIYANYVHDYILRDSARGQEGILVNANGATVYRNVDALLSGLELYGQWQLHPSLMLTADAAFTYGQNLDTNDALPQIPPLSGQVGLAWSALTELVLEANLNFALEQNRIDDDRAKGTGRDVGSTAGFTTLDVFATITALEPLELTIGATNVFDKTYANHLNRANIFDAEEVQVNEPGRTLFAKAIMPF